VTTPAVRDAVTADHETRADSVPRARARRGRGSRVNELPEAATRAGLGPHRGRLPRVGSPAARSRRPAARGAPLPPSTTRSGHRRDAWRSGPVRRARGRRGGAALRGYSNNSHPGCVAADRNPAKSRAAGSLPFEDVAIATSTRLVRVAGSQLRGTSFRTFTAVQSCCYSLSAPQGARPGAPGPHRPQLSRPRGPRRRTGPWDVDRCAWRARSIRGRRVSRGGVQIAPRMASAYRLSAHVPVSRPRSAPTWRRPLGTCTTTARDIATRPSCADSS
jgi:hypothetical protein